MAQLLLQRGETVIGLDNLNDYYDPRLKNARLRLLQNHEQFTFVQCDITNAVALDALLSRHRDIDRVVHLASQAGVRHSLSHPEQYLRTNIDGQFHILEACRKIGQLRHAVYASSSSVYGGTRHLPFRLDDPVDRPMSLYGMTKRTQELMAATYSHVYDMPLTGLRFFTVYGPWGRPDMAAYIFTKSILSGTPIRLNNGGVMKRDFTYIDDIADGVVAALDNPSPRWDDGPYHVRHRVFNLGNHRSEDLRRMVEILEQACGRKAIIEDAPLPVGDVPATFADISAAEAALNFQPKITIDIGLPRFVAWYRDYHQI